MTTSNPTSASETHPTQRIALGATLAGGAALVSSALLPWTSNGVMSSRSGVQAANLVLSGQGTLPGLPPAWIALAWYSVPVLGAALWIATGLDSRTRTWRTTGRVAVASAVPALIVATAVGWAAGLDNLGVGAWCDIAGASVLLLAGSTLLAISWRRP